MTMKKFIMTCIIALLAFATVPTVAHAEPNNDTIYGMLTIELSMPTGVVGDVTLTLTNITTNEDTTVFLTASQGNKYSFTAPLGTYKLKSSSVSSTDGYSLGYTVVLDDFTMDMTNPNGDWSWTVKGEVKAELPTEKPTTAPTNSPNPIESGNPHGEEVVGTDILTFTIDENNAYFPNMTIPQIQEWYTKEVTAFISSGKTELKLTEFQSDVSLWSDWVTRKNDSTLNIKYRVKVEAFNKEGTTDFYEVQKKIYDFLREYYKENGTSLNFSTWSYENIVSEEPTTTPTPEDSNIDKPTETIEPTTEELVSTVEPTATPTPEPKENKFISVLKSAWFSIIIIILLIIGGIVWKIKYKKSDD
jgi:hypothetical protein